MNSEKKLLRVLLPDGRRMPVEFVLDSEMKDGRLVKDFDTESVVPDLPLTEAEMEVVYDSIYTYIHS